MENTTVSKANDTPVAHSLIISTPKPTISSAIDDMEDESEEFKRLMSKTSNHKRHKRKTNKQSSKNTRNLQRLVQMQSNNTEVKKSRPKRFHVRRKVKKKMTGLSEECTFKPNLNKKSITIVKKLEELTSMSGFDRLTTHKRSNNKTPISHKLSREIEEMRECSFTPNLKQTERLNRSLEMSKSPRYEALHSKHKEKLQTIESKSVHRQALELQECTFIPKVNNTSLTLEGYKKNIVKERQKMAKSIAGNENYTTPNKREPIHSSTKSEAANKLYIRLYEDSERLKEK